MGSETGGRLAVAVVTLVFVTLAAAACVPEERNPTTASTGDLTSANVNPITAAEASCAGLEASRGDPWGIQACMDMGDRLRARRAGPAPAATPSEPAGPITWIAPTPTPHGATITFGASDDGTEIEIDIAGPIVSGDSLKLARVMDEAASAYPRAHGVAVFLNSPGGSVSEAAIIAEGLRRGDLPVAVAPHAQCASACFLIFASAKEKFASRSARIGVHSTIDVSTGTENIGAKAVTTELARACARVGVPPAIIGRMVTTPPGQVAWLSEAELASMGVHFFPSSVEQ